MRCIHASHAALFFFFSFCPFVCLFRSWSHLFTLHSCLRATFHSCFAVRRRPTPAFPPPPSSSRPFREGSVHKRRGQKKQTNPQHNRTKAQQNQEPCFAPPEPKAEGPRSSVAAPAAHGRGMRPPRRAARSCGAAPRRRAPPTAHRASVLAMGVVRRGVRACVCVFCFSQKVAEVQSRSRPALAAPLAGERRAGPGWRPSPLRPPPQSDREWEPQS